MAQWIKSLSAKPADLDSIPRTHIVQGEPIPTCKYQYVCVYSEERVYTYIYNHKYLTNNHKYLNDHLATYSFSKQ